MRLRFPDAQGLTGHYPGVDCQSAALASTAVGTTVGTVNGILQYEFGTWTIQPRMTSDVLVTCP